MTPPVESSAQTVEIITIEELAARWKVKTSWVREHIRKRCDDPIPHKKLGHFIRFEWGGPELEKWFRRQ